MGKQDGEVWGSLGMGKYGEVWGRVGKFGEVRKCMKQQTHSSELEHASSRVGLHAASALRIGEARSDAKGVTPASSMEAQRVKIAPYVSYYSFESYIYVLLILDLSLLLSNNNEHNNDNNNTNDMNSLFIFGANTVGRVFLCFTWR